MHRKKKRARCSESDGEAKIGAFKSCLLRVTWFSLYRKMYRSILSLFGRNTAQLSFTPFSLRVRKFYEMPLNLYQCLASPPCTAVVMTAQHLGVKINKIDVDLDAEDQLKPEYLKMNPQHCVPTIDDGGFYLWESRAIQTYLVNKYAPDSPVYPKDPKKRAIVDRMLYFDIGTLYKAEGEYLYPQLFMGKPADPEKEESFKKALALLEGFLEKTPYVAGDHLTLADFSILASLSFAEVADYSYDAYPKITAWLNKMKSEVPNYKEINDVPLNEFREFLKSKK